jgi:catechol 2,3-dioxygenase-like lactoylglutathione lyase family enzyme
MESILNKHAINQVMYYVDDIEKAARAHSALFGSGPFFYMDPITMKVDYRGKEIELTLAIAYGQFGNLQIEMEQVVSGTNPFAELGHYGFHHFSNWVDDFDAALQHFKDAGYEILFQMTSGAGMRVAFIDTYADLGHYVEIHTPVEGFWNMFKKAAENWDGTDVWRKFGQ